MAYKIPVRRAGKQVTTDAKGPLQIRIAPSVRRRMAKHPEVNWSEVCRHAVGRVLQMLEAK